MSFGFTNTPASFQNFINDTLAVFLNRYAGAYVEAILINSNCSDEHQTHIGSASEVLSQAGLHMKLKKCEFNKKEIKYLGLIIRRGSVSVVSDKEEAI